MRKGYQRSCILLTVTPLHSRVRSRRESNNGIHARWLGEVEWREKYFACMSSPYVVHELSVVSHDVHMSRPLLFMTSNDMEYTFLLRFTYLYTIQYNTIVWQFGISVLATWTFQVFFCMLAIVMLGTEIIQWKKNVTSEFRSFPRIRPKKNVSKRSVFGPSVTRHVNLHDVTIDIIHDHRYSTSCGSLVYTPFHRESPKIDVIVTSQNFNSSYRLARSTKLPNKNTFISNGHGHGWRQSLNFDELLPEIPVLESSFKFAWEVPTVDL